MEQDNDLNECPQGHGTLRKWDGKLRCWTCGYPGLGLENRVEASGENSEEHTAPGHANSFLTWLGKLENRLFSLVIMAMGLALFSGKMSNPGESGLGNEIFGAIVFLFGLHMFIYPKKWHSGDPDHH
jgi:hypothetical protein